MRSTDLKVKIEEIEIQLLQAQEDAETLPVRAGELAAAGAEKKADELFTQAEKSAMLVKRYSATLDALKKQYADTVREEKRQTAEKELAAVSSDIDRTGKRLEKSLNELAKIWNEICDISPESYSISSLKGEKILAKLFEKSFKGGNTLNAGACCPARKIQNEVDEILKSTIRASYENSKRNILGGVN